MKYFSTLRNKLRANLLNNNRGQGATEYILLLVVVVSLVVLFKDKIKGAVDAKTTALSTDLGRVTSE